MSLPGVLEQLTAQGFALGKVLTRAAGVPLRIYLAEVARVERATSGPHLDKLLEGLCQTLEHQRHPDPAAASEALRERPIIQQADHANLLLDSETFLNNYLFALGCQAINVHAMFVSQCTTVSCLSRRSPVAGPTFLRTRGRLFRTFNFSKTALKHSSFCALSHDVQLKFDVLEGEPFAVHKDAIMASLHGQIFSSPTDAFRLCNDVIWEQLGTPGAVKRVAVDESMTSRVAALHLADPTSPVHRLLFDSELRDAFLRTKRRFIASSRNRAIKHAAPDFFWLRQGTKLKAVVLEGWGKTAQLRLQEPSGAFPVPYTPKGIGQALLRGDLYVDKFFSYLVRCLLPGVVAVGGTSQTDYVQHYRDMLLACHATVPFLDCSEIARLKRNDLSRIGGAPLLELNDADNQRLAYMQGPDSLNGFGEIFLDMPVSKAIGALSCASYLLPSTLQPFSEQQRYSAAPKRQRSAKEAV